MTTWLNPAWSYPRFADQWLSQQKSADSTSTKGAKKPKKDERSALVNRMGVNPWHDWMHNMKCFRERKSR
jgi:hypothetical protein